MHLLDDFIGQDFSCIGLGQCEGDGRLHSMGLENNDAIDGGTVTRGGVGMVVMVTIRGDLSSVARRE